MPLLPHTGTDLVTTGSEELFTFQGLVGKMLATMASFPKPWGWLLYSQTMHMAVLEQTSRLSMQPASPSHLPSSALQVVCSFYQALSQNHALCSAKLVLQGQLHFIFQVTFY